MTMWCSAVYSGCHYLVVMNVVTVVTTLIVSAVKYIIHEVTSSLLCFQYMHCWALGSENPLSLKFDLVSLQQEYQIIEVTQGWTEEGMH